MGTWEVGTGGPDALCLAFATANKTKNYRIVRYMLDQVESAICEEFTMATVRDIFSRFLPCAVEGRNLNLVRKMIAKKADVNVQAAEGKTALHKAAEKVDLGILNLLLDNGADLTIKDHNGNTPLDVFDQKPRTRKNYTVQLAAIGFLRGDINVKDETSEFKAVPPLHYAVLDGDTETVKQILNRRHPKTNANPNPKSLAEASLNNEVLFKTEYLAKQIDINGDIVTEATKDGPKPVIVRTRTALPMTPLMIAAYEGHAEIFEMLLNETAMHPKAHVPENMSVARGFAKSRLQVLVEKRRANLQNRGPFTSQDKQLLENLRATVAVVDKFSSPREFGVCQKFPYGQRLQKLKEAHDLEQQARQQADEKQDQQSESMMRYDHSYP